MIRRRRRNARNRGERGQGMVEMALLLPFFLVMVVGVIEVADGMNAYITLIDSARDGARLGSKNLATDQEIEDLVLIETGRLRDDVTAGDVTVTHLLLGGKDAVRVEVCNDRTLLLNVPLIMPETFRMCSKTTMRLLPDFNSQGGPPPTSTPTGTPPTQTPTDTPTNTPPGPTTTPTNTPGPTPTPTNTPWGMGH